MPSRFLPIAAFCAALGIGGVANAGVYADDLAKCLVRSATDTDKAVLMRWMFGAFSTNPALASMTTVTPAQRQDLDRRFGVLLERLLFADCRKETVEGLKNEGESILSSSFELLGRVAARSLMSSPATAEEFRGLDKYVDPDKLANLYREAGVPLGVAGK